MYSIAVLVAGPQKCKYDITTGNCISIASLQCSAIYPMLADMVLAIGVKLSTRSKLDPYTVIPKISLTLDCGLLLSHLSIMKSKAELSVEDKVIACYMHCWTSHKEAVKFWVDCALYCTVSSTRVEKSVCHVQTY
jgi:hypothetical protein